MKTEGVLILFCSLFVDQGKSKGFKFKGFNS